MNKLGNELRQLREGKSLLLRELASELKIDQALLSKIERGERIATKKQIEAIANFFKINKQLLFSHWLGEKIAYEIKDEEYANDALKYAEEALVIYKKEKTI